MNTGVGGHRRGRGSLEKQHTGSLTEEEAGTEN